MTPANRSIMITGTGSDVGKTTIVTALCRFFSKCNIKVAPFKSQNMSLNSFATLHGEEIARSTAVQAFAANAEPSVHMNPILLKPANDCESQVIVHGIVVGNVPAKGYFYSDEWTKRKLDAVQSSIYHLQNQYDLIIAEGAGSCAEPNFRHNDIVNMGLAHLLQADVYLAVDIDNGGAFANILGTLRILELISPNDVDLIKGVIINKFRGDKEILQPAIHFIEHHAGIPVVGVLPFLPQLALEEEDRVKTQECLYPEIDVAVVYLPHISNANDFNPLAAEENVRVRFVRSPEAIGSPDLIILPGSKSVIWDLQYIRRIGWVEKLRNLIATTPLMGICGGFEMMGKSLHDPEGIESEINECSGLSLFDFRVFFKQNKVVSQVKYQSNAQSIFKDAGEIKGYEIHCGEVQYGNRCCPMHVRDGKEEGAISTQEGSLICGTFIHDIFKNPRFTRSVVNHLRQKKRLPLLTSPLIDPEAIREKHYNDLANAIESHCPQLIQSMIL